MTRPYPQRLVTGILVVCAAALGTWNAHGIHGGLPHGDELRVYLPAIQRLLAQGPGYFLDEASLGFSPMSVILPALLGGDAGFVRAVNTGLFGVLVVMVFRIGWLAHSRPAGVVAAFLFALAPTAYGWFATVLSEPVFIFFTVTWMWLLCEVLRGGPRWLIPLAGLAFGLSLLSRGTYQYFLVLILAAGFAGWRWGPRHLRDGCRDVFLVHMVALILPLALLVKNVVVFGYPGLYTGAGAAFYAGVHPLNLGYEPRYLNLWHDFPVLHRFFGFSGPHTIEGDATLKTMAVQMLGERSLPDLVRHFVGKGSAFLFDTNFNLTTPLFNLRSARIIELMLGVVGLFTLRIPLLRWVIGVAILYQFAVHLPIVYTRRYTVAIDMWLVVLAGVGAVTLFNWYRSGRGPRRAAYGLMALALAGVMLGEWHRASAKTPMPDLFAIPNAVLGAAEGADIKPLRAVGMQVDTNVWRVTGNTPGVIFPMPRVERKGLGGTIVSLRMAVTAAGEGGRCGNGRLLFKGPEDGRFVAERSVPIPIRTDGREHWYHLGTIHLGLVRDGRFRLNLNCPVGARVQVNEVRVSLNQLPQMYVGRLRRE
ncbi:MAG: ArnT family glycosyltransferase [Leptospirillia bacterium]